MHIIRDLAHVTDELRNGAVAIGNFDGVHLGHANIARRLIDFAKKLPGPAVVFTFDPHPVRILRPEQHPPPLTWTERKAELLAEIGIDWVIAYPTDEALLRLEPEEFFQKIVRETLSARAMVEGPNFCFGHNRRGNVNLLGELTRQADIELEVVEPYQLDGEIVSSSRIRRAIAEGDVAIAARMLTCPYRIRGMVTHGAGRGGHIGFPTANLDAIDTLLPAEGVYAGRGHVGESAWPAAINIGPNPTFGESGLKVEVHLIDYQDSLYGQPLEVDFLARIRDVRPFGSPEELIQQLRQDVDQARKLVERAN